MRRRLLPNGRIDFIRQFCLFAGAYLLYRLVESWVGGQVAPAFRHANELISFERSLHIFVEPHIQAWAAGSHTLLVLATYVYLNAQTTLIVGALLYLYIAHNRNYYFVRNMLMVAMVIALFCYAFYPTAPPRFLNEWGFVDTDSWITGVSSKGGVSDLFGNGYAAMPSMHVAFAVMLAWPLSRLVRLRVLRVFWACWPLVITFITIVTANHFLVDALLGAATAAVAAGLARSLAVIRPQHWAPELRGSSVAAT